MSLRYLTLGAWFRRRYGSRVHKVPISAGFTCPNRERGVPCLYCDPEGSGVGDARTPVREQVAKGAASIRRKYGPSKLAAYFQAFSNTYAPPDRLKRLYDEALDFEGMVALDVSTRPDCLPEAVLDLLSSYAPAREVWLEIGLQSAHDRTLEAIGRGHTFADFATAWARARRRPLRLCVHAVFGLPGESREEMLETARRVGELHPDGVKFHNLYVPAGSRLEEPWRRGEVRLLSREEYADVVVEALGLLPPETAVHRVMGEAPAARLLAPEWSRDKSAFLRALDARLEELDRRQGDRFGQFRCAAAGVPVAIRDAPP